jgi:hypothetical protein
MTSGLTPPDRKNSWPVRVWSSPISTPHNPFMTEEQTPAAPKFTPEQVARRTRIFLLVLAGLSLLFALALGGYGWNQHQDYAARTSPPGGRTTAVTVDEVTEGRFCSASNKTSNCSPEYTLSYVVDGERHTTPIRKHLDAGDEVHAFQGSDGKWYVTEDAGFGNSRMAWLVWMGLGLLPLGFAVYLLRSWRKTPQPA